MSEFVQLRLPGCGVVNLKRRARGRKPPPARWTFALDPAGERLVWMEKHDTERFAQLPDVVQKSAAWYGLARLAWLAERDTLEGWKSA